MIEPLLVALLLEILDVPRWWRGHLVSRLIPPQIHPVSLYYRLVAPLARDGGLRRGVLIASTAPAVAAAVAVFMWLVNKHIGGLAAVLIEGYMLKLTFSITHIIYPCLWRLSKPDFPRVVQEFVRRDLSNASRGHVNSACIETAAESLVDSFISPLFWYAILGLPGAWLQRLVNTLDGLVGFPERGRLGAPSAYLDTAMNYIPARVAALLILAVGGFRNAQWLSQRRAVPSINAGWPIAAMAAALGVRLEKPGAYSLGGGSLPDEGAVRRGLATTALAAAAWSAVIMLIIWIKCQYF
ncbi:MAG: CobD/CbiB family cobalamin biosynthesis protein [Pyrobaculum sp.]